LKHVVLNRELGIVRTVAVFGPGRSGTSVIAGCLRALGICMGAEAHLYKHEWSPLVRRGDGKLDVPSTRQNIQQMNENHPRWGWKFPSDVFHVEEITGLLRHPGFIVVTRDLTEIALSSLARQDVPFELSIYDAATVSRYISSRIRFWAWPILVLPFAEVLRQPDALIAALCRFLEIEPGEAKRKQAVDYVQPLTRGYRPIDAPPDHLHDFSPVEDNLKDSQLLAVDLSKRYGDEYLRHFEDLLPHTRHAADRLEAKIRSPRDLAFAAAVIDEIDGLRQGATATGQGKNEFNSAGDWRAALERSLQDLLDMAKEANIEAICSMGGYDGLIRLHRALQLLIRIRAALDGALSQVGVETGA
jgi:hypothetical protein